MIEGTYTSSVHKRLKALAKKRGRPMQIWKISDKFTSGVPDAYYRGDKSPLWVEYKYLKQLPKRYFTPNLTEQQRDWLKFAYDVEDNVAVVVGSPDGGIILRHRAWEDRVHMPVQLHTYTELAEWIMKQTTY